MGGSLELHSGALQAQGLAKGEGAQITVWPDELRDRGQKRLTRRYLAGELPGRLGNSRERLGEIMQASSYSVEMLLMKRNTEFCQC